MGNSGSQESSVRSVAASGSGAGVYETARARSEYLQFHYDDTVAPYACAPSDALSFAQRCADVCIEHAAPDRRGSALDVGCAVGGSSFQLARGFDRVVGVDFSQSFIDAANEMKKTGSHEYNTLIVGEVFEDKVARVNADEETRNKCDFRQGDACNLGAIGSFDCVLAANLLCRLPEPQAFLNKVIEIIPTGGILVLVSPYSWLPEYTKREKWLGGKDGQADSFAGVRAILEPSFTLEKQHDMPFLLREHARKFQWGISDLSVWRRN